MAYKRRIFEQDHEHMQAPSDVDADDIGAGMRVLMRSSPRKEFASRGAAFRMDGRSAEARYMRNVKRQLTQHIGGKPSAVQLAIIDRAAWLALHMAKIDARAIENGSMSAHARREYLAWSSCFTRLLTHLDDVPARPTRVPSVALADYLAQ